MIEVWGRAELCGNALESWIELRGHSSVAEAGVASPLPSSSSGSALLMHELHPHFTRLMLLLQRSSMPLKSLPRL